MPSSVRSSDRRAVSTVPDEDEGKVVNTNQDALRANGERPQPETLTRSLVDIAVEAWRLSRMLDRVLAKLDRLDEERYRRQVTWFAKKVDASLRDAGLRIVQIEGQPFDPGMAATALNLAEFGDDVSLVVDQMIEHTVMGPEGIAINAHVGAATTGEEALQDG